MAVTANDSAPYAPASAVAAIIQWHRKQGLPVPVDGDVLSRVGVSHSLIPRTLQTLQVLDLIDSAGAPSLSLERIRLASDAELPQRLQEWLTVSYADILKSVHPATSSEAAIRDAFAVYKPAGQQSRMVRLFMELFKAAGVTPASSAAKHRQAALVGSRRPTWTKKVQEKPARANAAAPLPSVSVMPPALEGLLSGLPADGESWTQDQRDAFLRTFGTVLDYCFPPEPVKLRARG